MSEPTYAVSAEPCPRTTAEGENKFWALLESAPAAMVIANQDGIIVLANIQTQKLFGYSREELQGQNVDILVPERFRGSHPSRHWGYFTEPDLQPAGDSAEVFGLRRDGTEFRIETSLSPLKTDTGMLVTSAILDITDHKRAEEINDLLDLAKIDSGEVTLRFVPINCQEVVAEVVETLLSLATEKGLELSI